MTHITDGMRFRMFTIIMQSSDDGIASSSPDVLRAELDGRINTLATNNPEAYRELCRPKGKRPDLEHRIEVEPWDFFSFSTYFQWGQDTIGFGQYSISVRREGDEVVISASNENMGVPWQRQAVMDAVDGIFKHIPDEINFEDLPKGEFRIKVPDEVLAHEKKLLTMMTTGEPEEPQQVKGQDD
jgi:hypothetical protein